MPFRAGNAWGPNLVPQPRSIPKVPGWFGNAAQASGLQPVRPAPGNPTFHPANPPLPPNRWNAPGGQMITLFNSQGQPYQVPLRQRFTGLNDDHLGFALSQTAYIEQEVWKIQYDDIQYRGLVPVDTKAHQWARTITHFSQDGVGEMQPVSGDATDFPFVELSRDSYNVTVEMFGIAYGWNMEEMGQAMMIPGQNLSMDKAELARRTSEEYLDKIVAEGSTTYGWDSLIKSNLATRADVADGDISSGNKKLWSRKAAEEIILDINTLLQGVYTDTNTVSLANTLLVPPNVWAALTSKVIEGTSETVTSFIKRSNVYTMKTGRQLMIREFNGLQASGTANHNSGGRIVAYRRDPSVLRLHLPMPFMFLPVQQEGMRFVVYGILRTAGLEIRQPKLIRYGDGVS